MFKALTVLLLASTCWAAAPDYLPTLTDRTDHPPLANVQDAVTPYALTLYWENDGGWIKPVDKQDRHYTNGIALSLAARPAWARDLAAYIPSFWDQFNPRKDHTSYAVGFIAVQQMYTPERYELSVPDLTDRPYAGYLYGGLYLQRAVRPSRFEDDLNALTTFEHLQLDVGVIGPASLAKQAQEWVHGGTGVTDPRGWQYQLHDEPTLDFTYIRKWRYRVPCPYLRYTPVEIIPEAGFTVGTVHREAVVGATFRWSVLEPPDDFGPARLRVPAAFTATREPSERSVLQFFARPAVYLVEHNTLIEGNNFRGSYVTQDIVPVVGELQFGFAAQFCKHFELNYSWTLRTKEFAGQHNCDRFGALTFTAFFDF